MSLVLLVLRWVDAPDGQLPCAFDIPWDIALSIPLTDSRAQRCPLTCSGSHVLAVLLVREMSSGIKSRRGLVNQRKQDAGAERQTS